MLGLAKSLPPSQLVPKAYALYEKIQVGNSSWQERVGGLREGGPGPHPQDGFGLTLRSVCPALYSMRQTGSSTGPRISASPANRQQRQGSLQTLPSRFPKWPNLSTYAISKNRGHMEAFQYPKCQEINALSFKIWLKSPFHPSSSNNN